jgi:hypothetical protein
MIPYNAASGAGALAAYFLWSDSKLLSSDLSGIDVKWQI